MLSERWFYDNSRLLFHRVTILASTLDEKAARGLGHSDQTRVIFDRINSLLYQTHGFSYSDAHYRAKKTIAHSTDGLPFPRLALCVVAGGDEVCSESVLAIGNTDWTAIGSLSSSLTRLNNVFNSCVASFCPFSNEESGRPTRYVPTPHHKGEFPSSGLIRDLAPNTFDRFSYRRLPCTARQTPQTRHSVTALRGKRSITPALHPSSASTDLI